MRPDPTHQPRITGLDHLVLAVSDLERTCEFYRRVTEITLNDDHDFSAVRVSLARNLLSWLETFERQDLNDEASRRPGTRTEKLEGDREPPIIYP